MDQVGLIIQKRCENLLKQQGGQLALNKLYENYVRLYSNSYIQNSKDLMLWLKTYDSNFLFEDVVYYYCILDDSDLNFTGGFIVEKAKKILREHDGHYSLNVLLQKMKDKKYVVPSLTEEILLSFLKKYPYITLEKRSYVLCRLKGENLEQPQNTIKKRTKSSTYDESSQTLHSNINIKETCLHIVASTPLSKLYKKGLLSKKELEHCWRKDLKTVGDVIIIIERYQLTRESTRFTQYTLDIWFKIFDLWKSSKVHSVISSENNIHSHRCVKTGKQKSDVVSSRKTVMSQSPDNYPTRNQAVILTEKSKSFIKEYLAEHNKRPFWYELYHAAKDVQSKSYLTTLDKAIQKIAHQDYDDNVKQLLISVRHEYPLHKDFYFSDEQPLCSWRSEQLAEDFSESEFLHFVASVHGYMIVVLENDEMMIKSSLAGDVKPIEKEIKRCVNQNSGSNSLFLIDELLPIDTGPEKETGLKQFASAWLTRHYKIEVSGDSFWI